MVWFKTDETRPELVQELEAAGDRLSNLDLLGQQPHPEVLDLISRAIAVVSTSEAEGMPNVFLEAWARGIPVLSLDYDPDHKIQSLDLGLVAGDSDERFAEAARSLAEDAELRTRMGESARDYVQREHSPAAVADRWAEVLRGHARGWPRQCTGERALTLQSQR